MPFDSTGFEFRRSGNEAPQWPYELNKDSPQAQGLVGWWPLFSQGGSVARDLSVSLSNGPHNGTVQGTPTWAYHKETGLSGVECTGGSTDGFQLTSSGSILPAAPTSMTWMCRLRTTTITGTRTYFHQKDGFVQCVLRHETSPSDKLWWYWRRANGNWRTVNFDISVNVTYHVVCRWDGTTSFLDVNGISAGNTPAGGAHTGVNDGMYLCRDSGGNAPESYTGDFRLYDRFVPNDVALQFWHPATRWDLFWERNRSFFVFPVAAGGPQTVFLGIATETDAPIAIGSAKSQAIGITAETDSALAITANKSVTLNIATETDTVPGALGKLKTQAIGIASETDTALTIRPTRLVPINIASETDVVPGALGRLKAQSLGIAVETDAALAIIAAKAKAIGIASETNTALLMEVVQGKEITIGIASETDAPLGITSLKLRSIGLSTEIDLALAMAELKSRGFGQSLETNTALPMSVRKAKTIGIATSNEIALPMTVTGGVPPGAPTSIGRTVGIVRPGQLRNVERPS